MRKVEPAFGVSLSPPYFEEGKWSSPFNYWPEIQEQLKHPKKVLIHDVTLRDGEQTARVTFTPEEKIFLAQELDKLGVHSIEPGLPATPEDREVIKTLAAMGLNAKIVPLVRLKEKDIEATLDAQADGMLLEFGINPYLLKYVYKISPETLMDMIVTFSKAAKGAGMYVEFMGWDVYRIPDKDYIKTFFTTISEKGELDRITVADTFGMGHPLATYRFIQELKAWTGKAIGFHIHNDFGLATASSLMAVAAGADMIHSSVNGLGERAGNVATEEISTALEYLLGVNTGIRLERLKPTSDVFAEVSKVRSACNKPIVGDGLFEVESGIVVHILRGMNQTELGGEVLFPYPPKTTGHDGYHVLAGRGSGVHSVEMFLEERGFSASEAQKSEIAQRIKQAGLRLKNSLPPSVLESILQDVMSGN